jgi:signal transduction histidine kinase
MACWACFIGVSTLGLVLSLVSPLRELSTIVLFAPLILGLVLLSIRGIVTMTILLAIVRVGVEAGHMYSSTGQIDPQTMVTEPIFPILLYFALAAAFVAYRLRQERLLRQLVDIQAREQVVEVADGLAHDFNNVLTAITGLTELLIRDPALDERARQDLECIHLSAEQGNHIVRRLRSFTHGDLYEFEAHDLNEVVQEQVPAIDRILPSGVTVKTNCTDESLPVYLDSDQFHRVMLNLCLNASTAMEGNGTITVTTRRGKRSAHVTVADTGPGMKRSQVPRIFEPGFTTGDQKGGSGMGLHISRRIVRAHDGQIECVSETGKGTSFDIALPHRQTPQAEPTAPARCHPAATAKSDVSV